MGFATITNTTPPSYKLLKTILMKKSQDSGSNLTLVRKMSSKYMEQYYENVVHFSVIKQTDTHPAPLNRPGPSSLPEHHIFRPRQILA